MDLKYQEDQTFAGTVTGLDRLRAGHRDSWEDCRLLVINSVNAGARLEQVQRNQQASIDRCARKFELKLVEDNVKVLMGAYNDRRGFWRWVGRNLTAIVLTAVNAVITIYLAQHLHP